MAGMTITEKTIADALGLEEVKPGDMGDPEISILMTHDVLGPDVADLYNQEFQDEYGNVWNPDRIVVFPDHFVPAMNIDVANRMIRLREFVKDQKITHYYPEGRGGICHEMMAQEGFALPGYFIIGTDSHTCTAGAHGAFSTGVGTTDATCAAAYGKLPLFEVPESMFFIYDNSLPEGVYSKDLILYTLEKTGADGALGKAMEFTGKAIGELSMDQRRTVTNMAVEGSAVNGIIAPDAKTREYVANTRKHPKLPKSKYFQSDSDAVYAEIREIDASEIPPMVSTNILPADAVPVTKMAGTEIDQAFIGSCTNGKYEDLVIASGILDGYRIPDDVRLIIIPATQEIWNKALDEGLLKIFSEAGGYVSGPTCGPCLGGYMGVLGNGERCIATTNRNFEGRMGDKNSHVNLASPATVAASAITGVITDPRGYL